MEIKLGNKVKDIVTGYTGTATSRTEYLNGCVQIHVLPDRSKEQIAKGEYPKGVELDVEQLKFVSKGISVPEVKVVRRTTGGPPKFGGGRNKH